jgi:hypothetical protein
MYFNPGEKVLRKGEYELKRSQLHTSHAEFCLRGQRADYRVSLEPVSNPLPPQLPTVATFASKTGTNFRANFVRAFSATVREFSAMTVQLNPGQ